jgi:hypothetical protein
MRGMRIFADMRIFANTASMLEERKSENEEPILVYSSALMSQRVTDDPGSLSPTK